MIRAVQVSTPAVYYTRPLDPLRVDSDGKCLNNDVLSKALGQKMDFKS